MPLVLRRKTGETFRLSLGDGGPSDPPTILVGKRLTHGDLMRINARATKRGVVDAEALDAAFWEEALVGWENLYAANHVEGGPPVLLPFDPSLAVSVGQGLPEDAATTFTLQARAPAWHFRAASGNSNGSLPAAATATTPSPDSASGSPTPTTP